MLPRRGDTACASVSTAAICCAGLMTILLVFGIMDLGADGGGSGGNPMSNVLCPRCAGSTRAIGAVTVRGWVVT